MSSLLKVGRHTIPSLTSGARRAAAASEDRRRPLAPHASSGRSLCRKGRAQHRGLRKVREENAFELPSSRRGTTEDRLCRRRAWGAEGHPPNPAVSKGRFQAGWAGENHLRRWLPAPLPRPRQVWAPGTPGKHFRRGHVSASRLRSGRPSPWWEMTAHLHPGPPSTF